MAVLLQGVRQTETMLLLMAPAALQTVKLFLLHLQALLYVTLVQLLLYPAPAHGHGHAVVSTEARTVQFALPTRHLVR